MHLLNLTLQPATAVTAAVVGSFSGKGQEILVVRGSTRLEILKLNPSTGERE
jgi:splicing factor 3B subunit 3